MSLGEVFTKIYREKFWCDTCGTGSTKEYTLQLIPKIQDVIDRYNVKTLLDAPSGLYRWMSGVRVESYIGSDIVEDICQENRINHPDKSFSVLDITKDPLPRADLWICRACLFHLSSENIYLALDNWKKSNIPLALFTTNDEHNEDCIDGEHRSINMEKWLGKPLEIFDDGPLLKMGLWRL